MAALLDLLRDTELSGRVLAVGIDAADAEYQAWITDNNFELWARVAGFGITPTAWPQRSGYNAVILPLPANRTTLSLCLAAATAVLAADGILYLLGDNASGIKSSRKQLSEYFADIELLGIGGHGRFYAACKPLRSGFKLPDFRQSVSIDLNGQDTIMHSYPGLFAKGRLDEATAFLVAHLPAVPSGSRVLDYACGIGMIAKAVQQAQPETKLLLVDHDALAIHSAAENLPAAKQLCADSPAAIDGSFDLIVSNPPIHKGQALDYALIEELVKSFDRLLAPGGVAYFVTQVTVPVIRYGIQNKLAATEVAASKSFRIVKINRT